MATHTVPWNLSPDFLLPGCVALPLSPAFVKLEQSLYPLYPPKGN